MAQRYADCVKCLYAVDAPQLCKTASKTRLSINFFFYKKRCPYPFNYEWEWNKINYMQN